MGGCAPGQYATDCLIPGQGRAVFCTSSSFEGEAQCAAVDGSILEQEFCEEDGATAGAPRCSDETCRELVCLHAEDE